MMTSVQVVLVPVPCVGHTHWMIPRPRPYPREVRPAHWPPKTSIPVRDVGQVRRMIADAKKMITEGRASRLLRQLDR
jgi:hypothetical protein